jgi:hypothetical protein
MRYRLRFVNMFVASVTQRVSSPLMSDKPNMNIRVEESLKEGLQKQADASDRTLPGQVRFILRQAVRQSATITAGEIAVIMQEIELELKAEDEEKALRPPAIKKPLLRSHLSTIQ